MDRDFWQQRWQRNEIGFHRDDIHPALERHWAGIARDSSQAVLVPLCGKSLDLHWLAERGHAVVGIELAEPAVAAFFDEAGLQPRVDEVGSLRRWRWGRIEIYQGDFFHFRPDRSFELLYDRAALIALPPEMRPEYLRHLDSLLARPSEGLLITLEYPQDCMDGPPFSVMGDELTRFERVHSGLRFERLECRDVLATHPRFRDRGLPWLSECEYRVLARGAR
ncbi:MAG: thiopurine S-methyltransferase [Candidatus Wenzhouxiangella sp. M2_3B_020]